MNKTSLGLVSFALNKLGCPYWYGTFGNIADENLLTIKARQYPSHYSKGRIPVYRTQFGKQVFDCVGLIKGFLWENEGKITYNINQDVSANGLFSLCTEVGKIKDIPEIPGLLVFMNGHTGIYIGGGEVVEARGFAYGVVKTKLYERPWKSFGKCPFITYITLGNIDKDGKLTAKDARIALRAAANLTDLDKNQILAGDIDGDGKISAADAREILKRSANLKGV